MYDHRLAHVYHLGATESFLRYQSFQSDSYAV